MAMLNNQRVWGKPNNEPAIWGWFLHPISGNIGDGLLLGLPHYMFIQTPGSPTLKQHIQTIWYTYHLSPEDENTGYTQWFWL